MEIQLDCERIIGELYQKVERIVATNAELRDQRDLLTKQLGLDKVISYDGEKIELDNKLLRKENEELRCRLQDLSRNDEKVASRFEQLERQSQEKESLLEKNISQERLSFQQTMETLRQEIENAEIKKMELVSQIEAVLAIINKSRTEDVYSLKHALLRVRLESVLERVEVALAKLNGISSMTGDAYEESHISVKIGTHEIELSTKNKTLLKNAEEEISKLIESYRGKMGGECSNDYIVAVVALELAERALMMEATMSNLLSQLLEMRKVVDHALDSNTIVSEISSSVLR